MTKREFLIMATKTIKTKYNAKYDITWTSADTRSTLRNLWFSMFRRCNDPEHASYDYYKRVPIQREWKNFAVFKEWSLANGYEEGLSPDRINPGYGYIPKNVRWVDPNLNKKTPILVDFEGRPQKLVDIAARFDIADSNLRYYYYKGWKISDAVDAILNSGRKKRSDTGCSRSGTIPGSEVLDICSSIGYDQKTMATAIGVSQQRFSAWVLDKNAIPQEFIEYNEYFT
jgi:hypothetical protein